MPKSPCSSSRQISPTATGASIIGTSSSVVRQPLALNVAPDQPGEREAQHELDDHAGDDEADGQPERAPEDRIVAHQLAEVVEAR